MIIEMPNIYPCILYREGLDEETVIESVLEGARAQTQVIVGILLVALRLASISWAWRVNEGRMRFRGGGADPDLDTTVKKKPGSGRQGKTDLDPNLKNGSDLIFN